MNNEEQLSKFREAYPSIHVMVYDDILVYSVGNPSQVKPSVKQANELIKHLELKLVAESGKVIFGKAFTVKPLDRDSVDAHEAQG